MEIATNTTFIVLLFMYTLIIFILTFKTLILLGLTNLDLEFRVQGWSKVFGI